MLADASVLGAPGKCDRSRVFFETRRTAAAIAACPSIRSHVLDLAGRIMRWPDVSLPWLAIVGVHIVGDIPPTVIFPDTILEKRAGGVICEAEVAGLR